MSTPYDWVEHFSSVPAPTLERFVRLDADACGPILEQRGLPRVAGEQRESAENRVLVFGDVVLKVFRPGRWSLDALREEVIFLDDLRDAGVSAVRPIGGIEEWEGLYHLAYERIPQPYEEDLAVFDRARVEQLVQLVADVHRVGAQRDAPHRPRLEPSSMGRDLLSVVDARGYLPEHLASRYRAGVGELCTRLSELLVGVPQQRIHADLGSWNVAWRPDGPLLMDLDDFQVGPTALDIRLMSFPWRLDTLSDEAPRRERREAQHELVVELYRRHLDFPESREALFEPTSLLRGVVFDAWLSHNWDEEGFKEHYLDDDVSGEAYWVESLEAIERWLGVDSTSR